MFRGRYKNRGGRGGRGGQDGNPSQVRGLFEKNAWLCDCNPRLPAEHFRVKKEGANQGRWFYTCQKAQSQAGRCNFFLWEDDAKPRMEAAVLNNSTSEPRAAQEASRIIQAPQQRASSPASATSSPPPPYTLNTPTKRKLPWVDYDEHDEDAEVFPWALSGEDMQALSQATDEAVSSAQPITPRKAAKFDNFSAPGRSRVGEGYGGGPTGLPTPDTTPHKPGMVRGGEAITPTPLRFGNASATPSSEEQNTDLSTSVFAYLRSVNANFSSETSEGLRALLDRHSMRAQGITRGREIARQALRTRDATIVSQAQRITALETDLESSRALVAHMRETLQDRRTRT